MLSTILKEPGRATIADVARRAGVDRAVVSKVLSGDPGLRVRAETRERVRLAARDLHYLPNFHARGLARARAGAIALLVASGNPLIVPIMAGAEEIANERGLLLWTATHEGRLTDRYLRLLRGGAVDAALIMGLHADEDAEGLFGDARVPTILVNRRTRGADRWVILDDERAAKIATLYLIEHGHTRIGLAGGPAEVDTAERRRSGYLDAMASAGLTVDPAWLVSAEYTPEGGAAAAHAFVHTQNPPTAVVAADANEGLGVWHALQALGRSVPDDISLIAIHRLPQEGFRTPAMTSVEMPLRRLGQRATELVLDQAWDAPIHEVITDDVVVVAGGTVARSSS
jgi:LacI family transcriptional regulator